MGNAIPVGESSASSASSAPFEKPEETYAFNSPERHRGIKVLLVLASQKQNIRQKISDKNCDQRPTKKTWTDEVSRALEVKECNLTASGSFGSSDRVSAGNRICRRSSSMTRANRSQSLEQNGTHSPSSSRSSSSTSYANGRTFATASNGAIPDLRCLRQSAQPKFQISGDLNAHQIHIVKRTWKQVMKSINDDETEIAVRLLLRIFQLDPRSQAYFSLAGVPPTALRHNAVFMHHVKAFEPTLIHVMSHPTNATSLSKYLQQLGGRHVQHTGVTYKCGYWKTFVQALIEVVGADHGTADVYDAFTVLGAFCVEQMRIGYKIEYKLLREARRLTLAQELRKQDCADGTGRKT